MSQIFFWLSQATIYITHFKDSCKRFNWTPLDYTRSITQSNPWRFLGVFFDLYYTRSIISHQKIKVNKFFFATKINNIWPNRKYKKTCLRVKSESRTLVLLRHYAFFISVFILPLILLIKYHFILYYFILLSPFIPRRSKS